MFFEKSRFLGEFPSCFLKGFSTKFCTLREFELPYLSCGSSNRSVTSLTTFCTPKLYFLNLVDLSGHLERSYGEKQGPPNTQRFGIPLFK